MSMESLQTKKPYSERVEHIEVYGGTAEAIDIAPTEKKSEVPVLFAPAWACSINVYEGAIETLSKKRRTLCLNHPRNRRDDGFDDQLLRDYPAAELVKAFNLLDLLDQKGIDKVDIVAHSEGCLNAMIAASLRPDKIRNIVLFAPAGMIGKDNSLRLLKGFLGQMGPRSPSLDELKHKEEDAKRALAEGRVPIDYPAIPKGQNETRAAEMAQRELPAYLKAHPIASLQEGLAMATTQILPLLRILREKGIRIAIMSPVDDPVFPTTRMAAAISGEKKTPEEDITNIVDAFLAIRGGHGEIGGDPKFMDGVDIVLTALEEKEARSTVDTSA